MAAENMVERTGTMIHLYTTMEQKFHVLKSPLASSRSVLHWQEARAENSNIVASICVEKEKYLEHPVMLLPKYFTNSAANRQKFCHHYKYCL